MNLLLYGCLLWQNIHHKESEGCFMKLCMVSTLLSKSNFHFQVCWLRRSFKFSDEASCFDFIIYICFVQQMTAVNCWAVWWDQSFSTEYCIAAQSRMCGQLLRRNPILWKFLYGSLQLRRQWWNLHCQWNTTWRTWRCQCKWWCLVKISWIIRYNSNG